MTPPASPSTPRQDCAINAVLRALNTDGDLIAYTVEDGLVLTTGQPMKTFLDGEATDALLDVFGIVDTPLADLRAWYAPLGTRSGTLDLGSMGKLRLLILPVGKRLTFQFRHIGRPPRQLEH